MVEIVKDNGVTTIAITNQSKSPLAELCDHVLLTATREHIFHDQVSFTRMAAMSVNRHTVLITVLHKMGFI